jgi:hypothetical protein
VHNDKDNQYGTAAFVKNLKCLARELAKKQYRRRLVDKQHQ